MMLFVTGCNVIPTKKEEPKQESTVILEPENEVVEEEDFLEEEIINNERDDYVVFIEEMSFVPPDICDEKAMEHALNEFVVFACLLNTNGVSLNVALEDLQIDITVEEYIALARANYDYFPNAEINYYDFNGVKWANLRGELYEGIVTEQLIAVYNDKTYILTYTSPFEEYERYIDYFIEVFKSIKFY